MAQMYPNRINPDTKSDAERRLYDAFRDQLSDEYRVFHSVAWQSLDRDGRPRDGEADFVIVHPKEGILVLEVKGGAIRHDPKSGTWASIARGGSTHVIKDPFNQAKGSKYTLLELLKTMLRTPSRVIKIGHAVAFPDVAVPDTMLGMDRPRTIILDSTDVAQVRPWIEECFQYYRGTASKHETAPGQATADALVSLLGKSWELRPALWGEFVRERDELIRLTEDQFTVLDALDRFRRMTIAGCAGSGKTMLAVEKATRLAQQGFHVLLTCFNKSLAVDLRSRLKPNPNLDLLYFHELAARLVQQAGIKVSWRDESIFFKEELPNALLDAADQLEVRYDAIVVDEGQDFEDAWWTPLQTLLRDPDAGILYIFYDDNQRLYVPRGVFPIEYPPAQLTINCRNTQRIHEQVLKFYTGEGKITARGPEGRAVEILTFDDPKRRNLALRKLLHRLLVKEQVPHDEIIVLTPFSRERSQLWEKTGTGGVTLTEMSPPPSNQVFCSSIHNFKGLERAIVIMTELERWPKLRRKELDPLLYVASSRARNHLIVLVPAEMPVELEGLFDLPGSGGT